MRNLRKQQWKFTLGYLLWVIFMIWFMHAMFAPPQPRRMSYSDFLQQVSAGHLQEVQITERQLIGVLKQDQLKGKKGPVNPRIGCTRIPGLDAGPLVQELEAQ